ncbi:apoptosis-enhancing nuclease [Pungitius pungitius]|uniref:apoptosis-enhancing nuclease n=1 Tax=Pungitius pungitius TaxID=134920 RepID=UPI002E12440E
MLHSKESVRGRKKCQQNVRAANTKRKTTDNQNKSLDTNKPLKKAKSINADQESQTLLNVANQTGDVSNRGPAEPQASEHHGLDAALKDSWEMDSGFSSEVSPPASGRSSPCPFRSITVVALDCEMVGTGPGGRWSELARCSILDYHGNVLYDQYVRPRRPVTDYRTRWSGIRRKDLLNAVPFAQAREEIRTILEGKVVVGHAIYNDFEALDMRHPGHMIRDTCTTPHLSRLASFPNSRFSSLKVLAGRLLSRRIQVGSKGHCSVEDALAALDLYKLVEGEWERELESQLRDDEAPREPSFASSNHYMQDEYWPNSVVGDGQ